ncbi:MAG: hypothetical protein WAM89_05595 [Terriglobales bacterium]
MSTPILLALAAFCTAFYAVLVVVTFRRLRKPTCRVCSYRGFCSNRKLEYADATREQCWSCGQIESCADPTPLSKA